MTGSPLPTVLITGSARRIGKAIATDLAAAGHPVAVHANRSMDEAESVAEAIRANGGTAAAFSADLTDIAAVRALFSSVSKTFGTPSVIVNNASVFEDDDPHTFREELFDAHFAVHVKAPLVLAECLAAALGSGGEGLIVNIIDQRVLRLNPRFFTYTLSKSALWTATQTLAQALAPSIRVNAIGPGPTLANTRQQAEDFAAQSDAVLLKHGPQLSEFAATIRWLMAARSVTGQMIALDGGQHLAWETPDVANIPE